MALFPSGKVFLRLYPRSIITATLCLLIFSQTVLFLHRSIVPHVPNTNSVQRASVHRRHIAFASAFGAHSEVWGSVAWAMGRTLANEGDRTPASIELYKTNGGFIGLLNKFGHLPFTVRPENQFVSDLSSTTLFDNDPGAQIDLVILGTCEVDLDKLSEGMMAAWDARPADRKFGVVCIVHNAGTTGWFRAAAEWSRRGALRLMPISDHVAKRFKEIFADLSGGENTVFNSGFYDHVKIEPFYPVSDLTTMVPPPPGPSAVLSRVAVQGYYQQKRRDYVRLLADLEDLMQQDPYAWGYLPIGKTGAYEIDPASKAPPFELHLIGGGKFDIPKHLVNVIVLDRDLETVPFYEKIQSMDLMVPAFARYGGYLVSQASSTVHTSLECHVPILGTLSMLEAYPYLDSTAVVVRPHGLSEMEAVLLLRTRQLERASERLSRGPPAFRQMTESMMASGWTRSPQQWKKTKSRIWARNEAMLARLLRDPEF